MKTTTTSATPRGRAAFDATALRQELKESFASGRTRSIAWRLEQLDGIARFLADRKDALLDALATDLGKPALEAEGADLIFVRSDLEHVKSNLADWMKPEPVSAGLHNQPAKSFIQKEPLGVALIIGAWNYPVQLVLSPLVGAIAAGNCAVIKPSEVAPTCSRLLAAELPRYVDQACIKVVEGGVEETSALLEEAWDHIFYTGNGRVGRIIMRSAAEHLTPVTLELGGKSPCIVDATTDLNTAARRIVWGKFFNAGQTCVAPDYVLVEREVHEALLHRLAATVVEFYGEDPRRSPDYARIVNERHHRRLMALIEGETALTGGEGDEIERYIAPTILRNVSPDSPVMADEIFGPILPVLPVDDVGEAIDFINGRAKPLALYLFSSDRHAQARVLAETSSGGMTVNHVWMHLSVHGLPFGGVGESGIGAYHGRHSFDVFSHRRAVLKKPIQLDPPVMYPPYNGLKRMLIDKLL